jgi:predicted methyltransferase
MTKPNRAFVLSAIFFLLLLLPACSSLQKVELTRVVTSGRDGWQHPERVIHTLQISPGDSVAEIGAGSGYWVPWLSRAVGPSGRVYAVEVEDEKVAALEQLVSDEGLRNVEVIRGEFSDPLLPDGEIDLAMTCLTYHHIEARELYFRKLKQDLRPGGRVAHLDDTGELPVPLIWLSSKGHWTRPDDMTREMESAGYAQTESFDFLLQGFQVFAPTDSGVAASGPVSQTAAAAAAGSLDR